MFVTTILWFTAKFLVPNSSGVAETAMDVIAPEHAPIMAVLVYKETAAGLRRRRRNAPAIGAIIVAMNPGLDTMHPFLDKDTRNKFVNNLIPKNYESKGQAYFEM